MANILTAFFLMGLMTGLTHSFVLISPEVTNWGVWAKESDRCEPGSGVQGFDLLTERDFLKLDKTALNGIRLYCGNPSDGATQKIMSSVGPWGKWGNKFRCPDLKYGFVTGFQLKVKAPRLIGDESATNNVRFFCTDQNGVFDTIEGDGEENGEWGEPRFCSQGQVVCGIKTQVQPDQGNFKDDTALNNIALDCCPRPER